MSELLEASSKITKPNREPLVSVIISNYNYGRFLAEAIDSALSQDYAHIEIIVVDDGSNDNSREILLNYGSQVISVLKENGGQASAFNAGFARSLGEIIIFLDADDKLLPGTVRQVAHLFEVSPGAAKLEYRLEVMNAQSRPTGMLKPPTHLPVTVGDLRQQVLDFPYDLTWMATSGNAFPAAVLRQIFPIPEEAYGPVGADWYLSHLTPLFGPVICMEEVGAYYRVHGANHYEATRLDLGQVRQSIKYMRLTSIYIRRIATELGLRPRAGEILSVSYIANRLVSLKLDPRCHPVSGDSSGRLWWAGVTATLRRSDITLLLKLMFLAWFTAMSLAPRPLSGWLAEKFFLPERRGRFTRLLRSLHRIPMFWI